MASYGQLGHGYSAGKQLSDVLSPQYITALDHLTCTCISAGELHSAVVTDDGDVYSWGDGFCGQLGLGDKRPQLLPCQVRHGLEDECVASVSCGARHTLCVTEEGEVFSFGLGYFGVLGRGFSPFQYDSDVAVEGLVDDDDERPFPAQNNTHHVQNNRVSVQEQLSLIANVTLDDNSDQCYPKIIDSLQQGIVTIIAASAGHRHSMLLDNQGGLYTFGSGVSGALGHGDTIPQNYPLKVSEFAHVRIAQMSAGVDISMAVSTSGEVYAWGKADGGRIGLGLQNRIISLPRKIPLETAVDVECGYVHSLIVSLSGSIYMCGGVGVDGANDGDENDGRPVLLQENVWIGRDRPKDVVTQEKWRKYGKYEVKGRRQMLEDAERWS